MSLAWRVLNYSYWNGGTVARASLDTFNDHDSAIPLITVIPTYASCTPLLGKRIYANRHIAANPSTVTIVGTTRDLMTSPTCRVNPAG